MSLSHDQFEELQTLLDQFSLDELTEEQADRLEELASAAPEACDLYIQWACVHAGLRFCSAEAYEPAVEMPAEAPPATNLPTLVLDSQPSASPMSLFGDASQGMTANFLQGWPMAYLIGSVIFGVGLYVASLLTVTHHVYMAQQPPASPSKSPATASKTEYVGQITGMIDVKWADDSTAALGGARVPMGRKYALASGLMEITYDTGAKVILQGPAAYRVESRTGGFLSIGRLTARLEKQSAISGQQSASAASVANHKSLASSPQPLAPNANPQSPIPNPSLPPVPSPLFTIRTPTATVTDLGTEFGVEVTKDGRNRLHVFEGKVRLESRGSAVTASPKYELAAGESADVEPEGRVVRHSKGHADVVAQSVRFVRVLDQPQPLVAYWSMNEGQGKTAHDQSINHIDGWLNGPVTWTQGKFGSAIRVPGEGYVYCKSSPKLAFGKGDFTVALWFQAKDLTDWRWLLNYNGEGAGKDQAALVVTIHGTRLRVSLGEWFTDVTNNPTIDVNETDWYHIAVVRQRSLVQGYVNGRPDGSPVVSLANLPLGSMRLGQGPHGNAFEGALDDVALWNVALKPAQIKALAEGTATPLNVVEIDPPQKNKQ